MSLKNILLLPGILMAITTHTGCKKSNDNNSSPPITPGLTATINGNNYQADNYKADSVIGTYNEETQVMEVGGNTTGANSRFLSVGFYNDDHFKVGQPLSFEEADVQFYDAGSGNIYYPFANLGSHGTLTVTSWDSVGHKITGTFSGVLGNESGDPDSVVITNGHFSSNYSNIP